MSHYLSSFLIEPVVRQARRFSRPSSATSGEGSRSDVQAVVDAHTHRARSPLALSSQDDHESIILDDGGLTLPTRPFREIEDIQHADLSPEPGPSNLRLVELGSLEPALPARQYSIQNINEPLTNPDNPRQLHHALRSAASSFTASSPSVISFDPPTTPQVGPEVGNQPNGPEPQARDSSTGLNNRTIPEDDGMSMMRQRILAIQHTNSSNEVKARLVHGLMTENHNASQQSLHAGAHSPVSLQSSDRPFTTGSPKSAASQQPSISPPTSSSSAEVDSNPFHLRPQDLQPTYYQWPEQSSEDPTNESRSSYSDDTVKALGCAHYKRNIKLQCSACSRWYTCRFCHDAVEDHMLNRRETKHMLCMLCGCAQPAAEECALCSRRGAWYYCDVCKLWDDDPNPNKNIYHCDDCGICRIGQGLGKDFFHCKASRLYRLPSNDVKADERTKTCCVCMAIAIRDTHRCIERSTDSDCPICGEYMFDSPESVVFMVCGHSIHRRCYSQHMKTSYRCPLCSRSITNMETQFLKLERAIEAQPMPEEFRDTKAWVACNDCLAKTKVKYHWLGLKCAVCDSYNTVQLSLMSNPSDRPDVEPPASPLSATPFPPATFADHPPPISRGRRRRHSLPPLQSRPRASPSIPDTSFHPHMATSNFPSPRRRDVHSASPTAASPPFPMSSSASEVDELGSTPSDSEAESDAYSDVDFWGGESPRALSGSPPQQRAEALPVVDDSIPNDTSEDDDDDDSDDEDEDDEVQGHEQDRGFLLDRMDIFGHR